MSDLSKDQQLADIRARASQSVTEMVANPKEYYRVQQLLRDRQSLLEIIAELEADGRRFVKLCDWALEDAPGTNQLADHLYKCADIDEIRCVIDDVSEVE